MCDEYLLHNMSDGRLEEFLNEHPGMLRRQDQAPTPIAADFAEAIASDREGLNWMEPHGANECSTEYAMNHGYRPMPEDPNA